MSSHRFELLSAVPGGAEIAQDLVWTSSVVPLDPLGDDAPHMLETFESMFPDALLLEASEEPSDEPVLFRGIRGDVLLLQSREAAGCPETAALKDQAVVASDDRPVASDTNRAEARDAGFFQRSLGLRSSPAKSEFPSHEFPVVPVDHGHQIEV